MELKISERINRFRKNKNLTQEELANALGVSAQAVSNWERGGYPDITLLPGIAQFFEVSIDELLGNERLTREQLHKEFNERYYAGNYAGNEEKRIMIAQEYHRKYPNDLYYDLLLGWAIYHADCEINKNYRGEFRSVIDRLSRSENPYDIDRARVFRCMVCGNDELDALLKEVKSTFGDRSDIVFYRHNIRSDRARFNGNEEERKVCENISDFLEDYEFLAVRCPDKYGPSIKADFLKNKLRFFEFVETDGKLPAGWLPFRSRTRLVLAACLWASGKEEEGWEAFEGGMADLKEWTGTEIGEALPLSFDGNRYGGLKLESRTKAMITEDGRTYPFYTRLYTSADPYMIEDLLTRPHWAWFDSARNDPRYLAALDWLRDFQEELRKRSDTPNGKN